jgi:hypothetical protein
MRLADGDPGIAVRRPDTYAEPFDEDFDVVAMALDAAVPRWLVPKAHAVGHRKGPGFLVDTGKPGPYP